MATVTDVNLREIVGNVWASLIGTPPDAADDAAVTGPTVTAAVHLTGPFDASVVVTMTEALARKVTAAMLFMGEDELEEDDVRDAVGEVANLTGGNVKAALGVSCSMSLPSVAFGSDVRLSVPGATLREAVGATVDGEPLQVRTFVSGG